VLLLFYFYFLRFFVNNIINVIQDNKWSKDFDVGAILTF